jgi:hypothetical protein
VRRRATAIWVGVAVSVVALALLAWSTVADGGGSPRSQQPHRRAAASAHPFETAVIDPNIDNGDATTPVVLRRARDAGATIARINLEWDHVAPTDPGADATNPDNPEYRWEIPDRIIKAAVAAKLEPFVTILDAPRWARPNADFLRPDPKALGAFARAAARRYSGSHPGLPRVRLWLVWNEPNLIMFLTPQTENGTLTAADWYRQMVNAASDGLHAVKPDNVVVAGALAPYVNGATAPLDFMRSFFCVEPKCSEPARLDAWSVHPYTFGGPTHMPATPNGIALGNLDTVLPFLRDAQQRGELVSKHPVQLWVTEFSYDTNPPDPRALPLSLQARWTAQAFYEMYRSGVTVATWFLIRDLPLSSSPFQSGLYYAGPTVAADRPKPTLTAFRFPFVALVDRTGTTIWGRTPFGTPGTVVVERHGQGAGRWRPVLTLQTDRYGIFQRRLTTTSTVGFMRAQLLPGKEASLAFGLKPVPDRHIYPFG